MQSQQTGYLIKQWAGGLVGNLDFPCPCLSLLAACIYWPAAWIDWPTGLNFPTAWYQNQGSCLCTSTTCRCEKLPGIQVHLLYSWACLASMLRETMPLMCNHYTRLHSSGNSKWILDALELPTHALCSQHQPSLWWQWQDWVKPLSYNLNIRAVSVTAVIYSTLKYCRSQVVIRIRFKLTVSLIMLAVHEEWNTCKHVQNKYFCLWRTLAMCGRSWPWHVVLQHRQLSIMSRYKI